MKEHITEFETFGKFGHGKIINTPQGSREVEIYWSTKKLLKVESQQVDIELTNCKELSAAIEKACKKTSFLPILLKEELRGPKALVNIFSRPNKPSEGYATITKPNTKCLKFSLNRINLTEMDCQTPRSALQKVAFATGKIKLRKCF